MLGRFTLLTSPTCDNSHAFNIDTQPQPATNNMPPTYLSTQPTHATTKPKKKHKPTAKRNPKTKPSCHKTPTKYNHTKRKTKPSPNNHFNHTLLSTHNTFEHLPFNSPNRNCGEPVALTKKKQTIMANEQEEFTINLTLHDYPASLLTEFIENIVEPYYKGNLNAAIQDLMHKTIAEQEFIHNHITMIRNNPTQRNF